MRGSKEVRIANRAITITRLLMLLILLLLLLLLFPSIPADSLLRGKILLQKNEVHYKRVIAREK